MNSIGPKALKRCFFFALFLGVLIFLPARTLAYWQGWSFFVIMISCCYAATIYFLKKDPALVSRRLNAGPIYEKEPRQKIIQSITGTLVLAQYVGGAWDYHIHGSSVPATLVVIADLGIFTGFYVIFLTLRENGFASAIVEVDRGQRVISSGPYARVRHPMYSGAILLFVFTPLALSSWWALIPGGLLIAAVIWRLLDEEQFLRRNLDGYEAYYQRVRYRLVPGVW